MTPEFYHIKSINGFSAEPKNTSLIDTLL